MFGDISNSTFINNSATYEGGAVAILIASGLGSPNILNSQFIGNISQEAGGGAVYTLALDSIVGSRFVDNRSTAGGAVMVQSSSPLLIDNSTFIGNRTDSPSTITTGGRWMSAMISKSATASS